jgi:hypothetical protein
MNGDFSYLSNESLRSPLAAISAREDTEHFARRFRFSASVKIDQ